MTPHISVVIPALNAGDTLPGCLNALKYQSLPHQEYEIIVVDGDSSDTTRDIGRRAGARVIIQAGKGRPAARNTGIKAASGKWVVFTDADCYPTRTWLKLLISAVEKSTAVGNYFGAAGKTIGYLSNSPAARYVDLTGGLDAERHLSHPLFPCAPTTNLMYRRDVLLEVDGFDERYISYAFCELHNRMRKMDLGVFIYVPGAVVMHQHRQGWRNYWRQQIEYGQGYAQFLLHHRDQISWTLWEEMKSIMRLVKLGFKACLPSCGDETLLRRGDLIKNLAQKIGFEQTYWCSRERARW